MGKLKKLVGVGYLPILVGCGTSTGYNMDSKPAAHTASAACRSSNPNPSPSALIEAIKLGGAKVERVKELLAQGADPNIEDEKGNTALHCAVRWWNLEAVEVLLKPTEGIKANPNLKNKAGQTPLHLAAADTKDRTTLVTVLLENGADPNIKDSIEAEKGNSPLHLAIAEENQAIVTTLLDWKADPDSLDADGYPPIYLAALNYEERTLPRYVFTNDQPEIIADLLARGANPDFQDEEGGTTLHLAVENGILRIVKKLFAEEQGIKANPNLTNEAGQTPLHLAIERLRMDNSKTYNDDYLAIIKILLEHGAKPNMPDKSGKTPQGLALENPYLKLIANELDETIKKLLTEASQEQN